MSPKFILQQHWQKTSTNRASADDRKDDDLKMIVGSGDIAGATEMPFRAHHMACLVVSFLSATIGSTTSCLVLHSILSPGFHGCWI
jgi:hypothetical protein